jgi:hypothetical protein
VEVLTMGIVGYLYQGEIPAASDLVDSVIKLLVACEVTGEIEAEACQEIAEGLIRAWVGVRTAEAEAAEGPEFRARYLDYAEAAELYQPRYVKAYCRVLGTRPEDHEGEGLGWLPGGLPRRVPRAIVIVVAGCLGTIEAEHAKATYRALRELSKVK